MLVFNVFFILFPTLIVSWSLGNKFIFCYKASDSQQIGAVSVEKMPSTKYEIETFTGVNDFGLWRLKMKALLVQQGCLEALKGESSMNEALTAAEKMTMIESAHSAILLNLGDKVLRRVSKETTTAGLWVELESLYMTKLLVNWLYLKQALY